MTTETILSVITGVAIYQIGKSIAKYYWNRWWSNR